MSFRKSVKVLGVAAIAALSIATTSNWNTEIAEVDGAHRMGKPEAEHALIEFVSYTCSHCANFTKEGDPALQFAFVGPGRMTREVRHIVRDPLDLTAAILAQCGDPKKFPRNHTALMLSQDKWLPLASSASPAQRQRWNAGPFPARARAIASDFGFYRIMERRGYNRVAVDRCLADEAKANAIAQQSAADLAKYELSGTPSFAVNGKVLPRTHDWATLEPQLRALYAPAPRTD